jgi:hypothetical protein
MDIHYVIALPIPMEVDKTNEFNKFKLPKFNLTRTTTTEEILKYQETILNLLADLNMTYEDDKQNKYIEDIIQTLSALVVAIQNKNEKKMLELASKLHNYIEMFNVTATFSSKEKSFREKDKESKLREFYINSILNYFNSK